jgi:hypothetical protein
MTADLISRLQKVRQTGRDSWVACCPAHEDKNPSMTIRDVDGKVLLHCFAGCEPLAILGAVGLQFSDLFADPLPHAKPMRRPFPAADVLEALTTEATIVLVLARQMQRGEKLSKPDIERLSVAIGRIEEGRRLANG